MDLRLFARVISRFRWVVLGGTVLALALAFLSYVKVGVGSGGLKVSYRSPEIWQSRSTLLLTQSGLGWGRSTFPQPRLDAKGQPIITPNTPSLADTSRFASLAPFYSQIANSDAVRARMRGVPGTIVAVPLADPISGNALPFLQFSGLGPSARDAALAARKGIEAFRSYLRDQQASNGIAPNQRVVLQVVQQPAPPAISVPRRKTRPVFIFVAVMFAIIALAFILENLRPRIRPVETQPRPIADEPRRAVADVASDRHSP
jgi:hypothetical protein